MQHQFCLSSEQHVKPNYFSNLFEHQARSQTIETGGAHRYEKKLAPNHGWAPEKNLNYRSSKMP